MGWLFHVVDSTLFSVSILDILRAVRMVSFVGCRHLQIVHIYHARVINDKVVMVNDVRSRLSLELVVVRLTITTVIIARGTHWFELSYLLLKVGIVFHHVTELVVSDSLLILPHKTAFFHHLRHG